VYQRLTTKNDSFVPKIGAYRLERVMTMIFSEFLRHAAESPKMGDFDAGE
jgi:hypothetical protein